MCVWGVFNIQGFLLTIINLYIYRTITAITPDGLTLTLDSALQYKHVAVTETFGSTSVELRGEVGLLSHNVKVRGSSDDQWSDKIPKCEEGFDTGLCYKIL